MQKASKGWLRYEKEDLVSVDQLGEYYLGKYQFGNLFYEERRYEEDLLFVGKNFEFPEETTFLKTINNLDETPEIYFAESDNK